jgi:regulator of replication initiation timing
VKELGARFSEVERRVRALVEENARLRGRVRGLEEELGRMSAGAREAEALRARKAQVQDRLQRLLRLLEAVETKDGDRAGSGGPA